MGEAGVQLIDGGQQRPPVFNEDRARRSEFHRLVVALEQAAANIAF